MAAGSEAKKRRTQRASGSEVADGRGLLEVRPGTAGGQGEETTAPLLFKPRVPGKARRALSELQRRRAAARRGVSALLGTPVFLRLILAATSIHARIKITQPSGKAGYEGRVRLVSEDSGAER